MKKIILLPLLALLSFTFITLAQPSAAEPFYLGGIQVNEPDAKEWVRGLKKADMNTVEVTVYAKQGDWDSDNLWFDQESEGIVQEIRAAKAQGLHVALILRVALDHAFERNEFLWHGLIMPRTDEQLDSWFSKYNEFVLAWAKISQEEGVDILGISSEMNSLTSTQPVNELPGLIDYYLDNEKQQTLIQEYLRNQDRVSEDDLWVAGGKQFKTLDEFLNARLQAWQGWAKQVSFGAEVKPSPSEALETSEAPEAELPKTELPEAELPKTELQEAGGKAQAEEDLETAIAKINQRRHLLDQHWRKIIRQTRQVYDGKLTYAANFDQYQDLTFWDALDQIGINAYFALRSELTPITDDASMSQALEAGWQEVLANIEAFRQQDYITDKPVLFTELGYTHRNDSTIAPWAYDKLTLIDSEEGQELFLWDERETNLTERALAIKALHKVLETEHPELLEGILYWKLSTLPEHMAIEPFVLILNDSPRDPLQEALGQFVK